MDSIYKKSIFVSMIFGISLAVGPAVYAANAIELNHQPFSILQTFLPNTVEGKKLEITRLEEINRSLDFNETLHVKYKETYTGYEVWGGEVIVHIPHGANVAKSLNAVLDSANKNHGFMNGVLYQDIQKDLPYFPASILNKAQSEKASQLMVTNYQNKTGNKSAVKNLKNKLIVFIDSNHKAHWAYQISFFVESQKNMLPSNPVYIIDEISFKIYKNGDDFKTFSKQNNSQKTNIFLKNTFDNTKTKTDYHDIFGGGYGGNLKIGKLIYDGLVGNLRNLPISRDANTKTCSLQNLDAFVTNFSKGRQVINFPCDEIDKDHYLYWDDALGNVNGGYSPENDAMNSMLALQAMYDKRYHIPVLVDDKGLPKPLEAQVHWTDADNAFLAEDNSGVFGDGSDDFYPLTDPGTVAFIFNIGFIAQHSGLQWWGGEQSGGINVAFCDMAHEAIRFYLHGKNDWQIGSDIAKGQPLRYMDVPSKDCGGRRPGDQCSIDDASEFSYELDSHYSCGVFNRAFYLIATSPNWNTQKAFDVMMQANRYYWTKDTDFIQGACGVIHGAKDYGYDLDTVRKAFATVKVDTSGC